MDEFMCCGDADMMDSGQCLGDVADAVSLDKSANSRRQ